MQIKKRLYEVLEVASPDDRESWAFDIFIIILIILNVIALTMSTVKSLDIKYKNYFDFFEIFSVVIFTAEYLGRIYTCVENNNYQRPINGRLRFMLRPMLIIDLLAILPFYLTFFNVDFRSFRAVRLFRLFRLVKLVRYVRSFENIGRAIKEKVPDIGVALTIILVLIFI